MAWELRRRALIGTVGVGGVAWLLLRPQQTDAAGQFAVAKTPAEWKRSLGPQRYRILREAGTERPYSSPLNKEHRRGVFACAGCGTVLFEGKGKFESGTGWPSFNEPVEGSVGTSVDQSFGMVRTEVHCATCGSHLGHVFPDGPPPTGLRYCMNGVALEFRPD